MEFNAVSEICSLAVRARLATHKTASRALKAVLEQFQEFELLNIPVSDSLLLTAEEVMRVLGAEKV
jgi:hypothetical protein